MFGQSKKTQVVSLPVRYRCSSSEKRLRKFFTAIVFPFAFFWFYLSGQKRSKQLREPEPINVFVMGRSINQLKSCHGKVIVRTKAEDVAEDFGDGLAQASWAPISRHLKFAFRVDQPELLMRPSEQTIRAIVQKFATMGYEVITIVVNKNGCEVVHPVTKQ